MTLQRWRIYFIRSRAFPEGRWHIDENGETLTLAYPEVGAAIDALRQAASLAELVTEYPRLKLVRST